MPAPDPERYWFPAKRFGWGWGPPATWQGWIVLLGFLSAQIWLALRTLPRSPVDFMLGSTGLVVVLMLICWLKGEPPSWRWGDRDP